MEFKKHGVVLHIQSCIAHTYYTSIYYRLCVGIGFSILSDYRTACALTLLVSKTTSFSTTKRSKGGHIWEAIVTTQLQGVPGACSLVNFLNFGSLKQHFRHFLRFEIPFLTVCLAKKFFGRSEGGEAKLRNRKNDKNDINLCTSHYRRLYHSCVGFLCSSEVDN